MIAYARAFWQLVRFHYYVLRRDFAALHRRIGSYPCARSASDIGVALRLCTIMDFVCLFYPKQVLCLHRSAATVCLLRSYGVPARMVTGVQEFPSRAHAWVEVDGRVVNDKPYVREIYVELDSC
jgi:hypothetical protein